MSELPNSNREYRSYADDRKKTDNMHALPCVQQVYADAGLRLLSKEEADNLFYGYNADDLDCDYGVDYICQQKDGSYVFIQERMKPKTSGGYMDINVRYERMTTKVSTEINKIGLFIREFQKGRFQFKNGYKQDIAPFFLVYCIVDEDRKRIIKRATVNLSVLVYYIEQGKIKFVRQGEPKYGFMNGYWDAKEQLFYSPIVTDYDGSSSFACFNVRQMLIHFPEFDWIKAVGDWQIVRRKKN